MNKDDHLVEIVEGFYREQRQIFDASSQGMYAYLDDNSRVCNKKFAEMLGYSSPEEWFNVDVKGAFPEVFVDPKSQQALVEAYRDAMEKGLASTIKVAWKKKSGGTVDTTVTLVPISFNGHLLALHFVS